MAEGFESIALTMLQARGEPLSGSVPAGLYLVPVWTALALGVLGAVVGPLTPADDRDHS